MQGLVKYPKTMHLPWSPGLQNDDRRIESLERFKNMEVVVTEKMDGENATLYRDHYHARSLDSRHHPSRDWIKAFHGQIKNNMPQNLRICGENMYAKHSIGYNDLPSYFLGFSAWVHDKCEDKQICLSWDDTLEFFEILDITPVQEIWRGPWEQFEAHHERIDEMVLETGKEGYVVRITDAFDDSAFKYFVAKFVRKGHVQTDEHWMQAEIIPNKLKDTQ
jgi:hypothetical protein